MVTDKDQIVVDIQITTTIKTSYRKGSEPKELNLTLDFSLCTVEQICKWATRSRVIDFQRVLRSMETEEMFNAFHDHALPHLDIFAIEAGSKLENHSSKQELYNKIKDDG